MRLLVFFERAVTCDSSSVLKAILANSDAILIMSLFMVFSELRDGGLALIRELNLGLRGRRGGKAARR